MKGHFSAIVSPSVYTLYKERFAFVTMWIYFYCDHSGCIGGHTRLTPFTENIGLRLQYKINVFSKHCTKEDTKE